MLREKPFFVQLFNVRRKVLPIVVLATADLCLTVFIFTVVVGLALAVAAVEFDRSANKHVNFSAAVTPDPALFSESQVEASQSPAGNPELVVAHP